MFFSDIQLNNPKITIVINTCHETFIGKLVPVIRSQLSYPFRHNFPLPLGMGIPDLKMNTLVNLRPFAPFNIKHQHLNIWAKQDYLCIIILISVLIICLISPVSPLTTDQIKETGYMDWIHGLIHIFKLCCVPATMQPPYKFVYWLDPQGCLKGDPVTTHWLTDWYYWKTPPKNHPWDIWSLTEWWPDMTNPVEQHSQFLRCFL